LIVYADTSFQVAAYIVDVHSPTVVRRMATRPQVYLTPFSRSEVANAIHRQAFTGKLLLPEAWRAWQSFESDFAAGVWQSAPFPNPAWETCVEFARRSTHPRRTDTGLAARRLRSGVEGAKVLDIR
jgi:hypothetical protein